MYTGKAPTGRYTGKAPTLVIRLTTNSEWWIKSVVHHNYITVVAIKRHHAWERIFSTEIVLHWLYREQIYTKSCDNGNPLPANK